MSNTGPIKPLDQISGTGFLTLQSTLAVVRGPQNLSAARLYVVKAEAELTVVAQPADQPAVAYRGPAATTLTAREFEDLTTAAPPGKAVETIGGTSYLAAQAAAKEFTALDLKPDLADYNVQVVAEGSSTIVIFTDKARRPGARGAGGKPGYEVELNSADRAVIRANFLR